MRLTYLGHSAMRLEGSGGDVLIDPYLSDNPRASAGPEELDPTHIVLTHAHGDHFGDTIDIARRSGALVVGSAEVATYVGARGGRTRGMNAGGGFDLEFGRLTFTPAWHSSSFPDGSYGGIAMGAVLEIDGVTVYHAGDTALFSDMQLIGRRGIDVAAIPIGDTFTMGPDDALEAVRLLEPKVVVPIHYDTFDAIRQDVDAFARAVEAATDATCRPLRPGEHLEL